MNNRIEKEIWKIFEDETKYGFFRTSSDRFFFRDGMIYTFQKLKDLGIVFQQNKN